MIGWLKSLFDPYMRYSSDENIQAAVKLLDEYTLKILSDNNIKIAWHQLGLIGDKEVFVGKGKDFYNEYILLNSKYMSAPPEQLACLITHESCHRNTTANEQEEILALSLEGGTWKQLKQNKEYKETSLYKRLEALSELSYDDLISTVKGVPSKYFDKVIVL